MARTTVTIKDIATAAEVSSSLVSCVMMNHQSGQHLYRVSPETEKKVLEIARKLNYKPNVSARALRKGEAKIIGVIVPDIANKFYSNIARKISDWASKNDYLAIFGNMDEKREKLAETIDIFESKGVEGFIIVPCDDSADIIERLQKSGRPIVLIDRYFPKLKFSSVTIDNVVATYRLTEGLIRKGCRKIVMISYDTSLINIRDRETGYLNALADNGLQAEAVICKPDYGSYSQMDKIVGTVLENGADGIVFATYRMALLGRKSLGIRKISIPGQLRIACFNNGEEMDIYENDIIYASQPIEQFASESISILMDKLRNGTAVNKRVVLDALITEIP